MEGGDEEAAREQILAAARQVYRDDISAEDLAGGKDFFLSEIGQTVSLYSEAVPTVVFGLFGIVSLMTSIGVFSGSLISVLERTRELGIPAEPWARVNAGLYATSLGKRPCSVASAAF